VSRFLLLVILGLMVAPRAGHAALPTRLVLALDGVAYRDVKALQEGVTYTDRWGRQFHRQAFQHGYFPVSRMISTFPSASDTAWTEILGNRPLPGYQRTYFSTAANTEIFQNGVTTSMEYERQMSWQEPGGIRRSLGYGFPGHTFKYEVREVIRNFLNATNQSGPFYAYLRSPDDAQHMSSDIMAMLCMLDERLQELRRTYRATEGRELEILILSDHGNNHAGPAERVEIQTFLKRAGYRVAKSIRDPKDVVLPTAGIESWVEIHNSPGETKKLARLLTGLEGVDLLTAQDPDHANQFLVMNSKGEQAGIEWNCAQNTFRYTARTGDPLDYLPVVEALSMKKVLDPGGFATAENWMAETLTHHYPLALERIARGHTKGALNPATILISLDNAHVHSGWLVKRISELTRLGGTHGALDDLNSNGMLLSSFAPTKDTSANRVADLFDGFKGMRDYRAEENGAEWISGKAQSLMTIARTPLDRSPDVLAGGGVFLRVWTPDFNHLGAREPVEVSVKKARHFLHVTSPRENSGPIHSSEQHWTLNLPVALPAPSGYERVYALSSDFVLEPEESYLISGRIGNGSRSNQIFSFAFCTDGRGRPVAY
jgi:hypothetical protein